MSWKNQTIQFWKDFGIFVVDLIKENFGNLKISILFPTLKICKKRSNLISTCIHMLTSKIENAFDRKKESWAEMQRSVIEMILLHFLKSHDAFWPIKNCRDARFVSWLLKKMATMRCGNITSLFYSFYSYKIRYKTNFCQFSRNMSTDKIINHK